MYVLQKTHGCFSRCAHARALGNYVCSRVRICVFHECAHECCTRTRCVPGPSSGIHMCVPHVHTCALTARVCFPGEHTCVPRVHTCGSDLDTRFIVCQVHTCVLTYRVGAEHMCVFQVYTCVCALQEAHVGFPAQHMYAPQVNVYVCGLTGAHLRVPRVLFQSYTYVCSTCAHTCVSELDTCV